MVLVIVFGGLKRSEKLLAHLPQQSQDKLVFRLRKGLPQQFQGLPQVFLARCHLTQAQVGFSELALPTGTAQWGDVEGLRLDGGRQDICPRFECRVRKSHRFLVGILQKGLFPRFFQIMKGFGRVACTVPVMGEERGVGGQLIPEGVFKPEGNFSVKFLPP